MAILLFYKNAIEKNTLYSFFQKIFSIFIWHFSFPMLIEIPIFNVDKKGKNLHFCDQCERFSKRRDINIIRDSWRKGFLFLIACVCVVVFFQESFWANNTNYKIFVNSPGVLQTSQSDFHVYLECHLHHKVKILISEGIRQIKA